MDREELKEHIISLGLDEDIEEIFLREVDAADKIDQEFLDRMAKLMNMYADKFDQAAEFIDQADEIYEGFEQEMKAIDKEEEVEIAEATLASDEQFLTQLEDKIKEIEKAENQQQIAAVQQNLTSQTDSPPPNAVATSMPSSVDNTTNHPAAYILNRHIMPPAISHQQTSPNPTGIPSELPDLNPNPVE